MRNLSNQFSRIVVVTAFIQLILDIAWNGVFRCEIQAESCSIFQVIQIISVLFDAGFQRSDKPQRVFRFCLDELQVLNLRLDSSIREGMPPNVGIKFGGIYPIEVVIDIQIIERFNYCIILQSIEEIGKILFKSARIPLRRCPSSFCSDEIAEIVALAEILIQKIAPDRGGNSKGSNLLAVLGHSDDVLNSPLYIREIAGIIVEGGAQNNGIAM